MAATGSAPPAGTLLLVGKHAYHFGATTAYSPAARELAALGEILVNAADASRLGVTDGARLKVTGPAGSAIGPARVSADVPPGLLFAPDFCAELNIQQVMPAGTNCVPVTVAKG